MRLFITLLACIGLFSCQKELDYTLADGGGTASGYYIKFKVDGTQKNFTTLAHAPVSSFGGGMTNLNLIANADAGTTLEGINLGISFMNGTQPRVGTFSENDPSPDHLVLGVYNPNSSTIVYGTGLSPQQRQPLKITILTKTNTEITGTFSGELLKINVSTTQIGPETVQITGGEFKLKLQ